MSHQPKTCFQRANAYAAIGLICLALVVLTAEASPQTLRGTASTNNHDSPIRSIRKDMSVIIRSKRKKESTRILPAIGMPLEDSEDAEDSTEADGGEDDGTTFAESHIEESASLASSPEEYALRQDSVKESVPSKERKLELESFDIPKNNSTPDVLNQGQPTELRNDFCPGAIRLLKGLAITGTTVPATPENGLPACNEGSLGNNPAGVWYRFRALENAFTLSLESNFAMNMSIFLGPDCNNLLQCVANEHVRNNEEDLNNPIEIQAEAGQRYYILVHSSNASEQGTFNLTAKDGALAATTDAIEIPTLFESLEKEACQNATRLRDGVSVAGSSTTASALFAGSLSCGDTIRGGTWYRFRPTSNSATASIQADFPAQITIFQSENCNNLLCIDQVYGSKSISWDARVGARYYVVVSVMEKDQVGVFNLTVTAANDSCQKAAKLVFGDPFAASTTALARQAVDVPVCGNSLLHSSWYRFWATEDTVKIILQGDFHVRLTIFKGVRCNSNLQCIEQEEAHWTDKSISYSLDVQAGEHYYIVVDGVDSEVGDFNLIVLALPSYIYSTRVRKHHEPLQKREISTGSSAEELIHDPSRHFSPKKGVVSVPKEAKQDNGNAQSYVATTSFKSFVGQTYYILIQGVDTDATGKYELSVEEALMSSASPAENLAMTGSPTEIEDSVGGTESPTGMGAISPTPSQVAPSNDKCADSLFSPTGSFGDGTTVGASSDEVPLCRAASSAPGVWYLLFVSSGSVDITFSSTYRAQVSIYSGDDCDSLSCVGVTEGFFDGGKSGYVVFEADENLKYYMYVHGFDDEVGDFSYSILPAERPQNDDCGGAEAVGPGETVQGLMRHATTDEVPVCGSLSGPSSRGLWYQVAGNNATFDATVAAVFDVQLVLFSGSDCDDINCIGATIGGSFETISWSGEEGSTYYLYVVTVAPPTQSTNLFSISLAENPPRRLGEIDSQVGVTPTAKQNSDPENDMCTDATRLQFGEVGEGSTINASPVEELEYPKCGGALGNGVWYSFAASSMGHPLEIVVQTRYLARMTIYVGETCSSLTCVEQVTGFLPGEQIISYNWETKVDTLYYVVVDGIFGQVGDFIISVSEKSPPGSSPSNSPTLMTDGGLEAESSPSQSLSLPPETLPPSLAETGEGTASSSPDSTQTSSPTELAVETLLPSAVETVGGTASIPLQTVQTFPPSEVPGETLVPTGQTTVAGSQSGSDLEEAPNDTCENSSPTEVEGSLTGDIAVTGSSSGRLCDAAGGNPTVDPLILDSGAWYFLIGTGGTMTISVFSDFEASLDILSGASCDALACVVETTTAEAAPFSADTPPAELDTDESILGSTIEPSLVSTVDALIESTSNSSLAPSSVPLSDSVGSRRRQEDNSMYSSTSSFVIVIDREDDTNDVITAESVPPVSPTVDPMSESTTSPTAEESPSAENVPPVFLTVGPMFEGTTSPTSEEPPSLVNAATTQPTAPVAEESPSPVPAKNNDCSQRFNIEVGDIITGSTAAATRDHVPSCGGNSNSAGGVWYSLLGTGTTLRASFMADYDAQLSVYEGLSCRSLFCIAGTEGFPTDLTMGQVIFETIQGRDYYIFLHGYNSQQGEFELAVDEVNRPENDGCLQAIELEPGDMLVSSTLLAADDNPVETCGSTVQGGPGIWFALPGIDGILNITVDAEYDAQLTVFSGDDCSELACVDGVSGDPPSFLSLVVEWESHSDSTYFVLVNGFFGQTGGFALTVGGANSGPMTEETIAPDLLSTMDPTVSVTEDGVGATLGPEMLSTLNPTFSLTEDGVGATLNPDALSTMEPTEAQTQIEDMATLNPEMLSTVEPTEALTQIEDMATVVPEMLSTMEPTEALTQSEDMATIVPEMLSTMEPTLSLTQIDPEMLLTMEPTFSQTLDEDDATLDPGFMSTIEPSFTLTQENAEALQSGANCSDARQIELNSFNMGSTSTWGSNDVDICGFAQFEGEPYASSSSSWYSIEGTGGLLNATLTIDSGAGQLSIFAAPCDQLACIGGAIRGMIEGIIVGFLAEEGTTYYLLVQSGLPFSVAYALSVRPIQ